MNRTEYHKKYQLKNKERIVKYKKEYYIKNKEKILEYNKKHICIKNKYNKNYYKANIIKILKQKKNYYNKNKKKLVKQAKAYYKTHKIERKKYRQLPNVKKQQVAFTTKYIKNNTNARVSLNLRNRINDALKGNSKSASTMFLVGCDIDYFMYHLQEQFTKGMTWDNYGAGQNGRSKVEWQMDHIKPCSSFNLRKTEEQRKCFHYSNIQPLWAEQNWKKGCD